MNTDSFVQLGHDGLATEAGFPQDDNVEVYDAWYGLPQVLLQAANLSTGMAVFGLVLPGIAL